MTPGARVQAAIEVLDDILGDAPAEKSLTNWARRSRFAGSKDRRAVRDHVYQALRRRRSFAARGGALSGRGLMIGALREAGLDADTVFNGEGHAPAPLTETEQSSVSVQLDPNDAWDVPDWMIPLFEASLGDQAQETAQALTERAPVMLRVNLRKAAVDQAAVQLAESQIIVQADPIAETALRVIEGGPRVQNSDLYRDGRVELQDGSSQAAMQTITIDEGARVLDYCAGGGGKTLALAARHQAHWFAHDALPQRMKDIPARAARADVDITSLAPDQLADQTPFDVVLCDVPCSGSGTWRRTPQAKWALTESRLTELLALQAQILVEAQAHVSGNGRLIYATCSLFAQENERQIDQFLSQNPEWSCTQQHHWPLSSSGDGFFVAHLCRVGI